MQALRIELTLPFISPNFPIPNPNRQPLLPREFLLVPYASASSAAQSLPFLEECSNSFHLERFSNI